jgi:hypothetical protein
MLATWDEAILRRTIVGEIKPPVANDNASRDGKSPFGASSLYLTANDQVVTVFGLPGILSVESFDVKTGRNVLHFATDYNGQDAEAAYQKWRDDATHKGAKGEAK